MKRLVRLLLPAAVALLVTSCASVAAYSDSILAGGSFSDANGRPITLYGDRAKAEIDDQPAGIQVQVWQAAPGTTLGDAYAHPAIGSRSTPALNKPGRTTTVFSFGTNDANYYAWGVAKSHSLDQAKALALNWIGQAFADGSKCVVWILGNPTRYDTATYKAPPGVKGIRSGKAAANLYTTYMNGFNTWLQAKSGNGDGAVIVANGQRGMLRTVDWGALARASTAYTIADRVHPSADGAVALGRFIKYRVNQCPAG